MRSTVPTTPRKMSQLSRCLFLALAMSAVLLCCLPQPAHAVEASASAGAMRLRSKTTKAAGGRHAVAALSVSCPAGQYLDSVSGTCLNCPAGSYCPAGSTSPTTCPAGSYCPASSSAAVACTAGYSCPSTGMSAAGAACTLGSACPTGTVNEIDCPAGWYCTSASVTPLACPLCYYCPARSTARGPLCAVGSFCPTPGLQLTCPSGASCPAGTYWYATNGSDATIGSARTFGTYLTPFTPNSPWNVRPVGAQLFNTSAVVPTDPSGYYPAVGPGIYSTTVFLASAFDPSQVVLASSGTAGPGNPDTQPDSAQPVTIPHWPAPAQGATGSDGHADIYDPTTGIMHSFWQLRVTVNATTGVRTARAALYGWTNATGSGFGEAAHYYVGPRATGVASGAGIIRLHEVNDGLPYYRHALALSLCASGLSSGYVFPATHWDDQGQSSTGNYGPIPEGALLMLPRDFDVSTLAIPAIRKVAETLKRYGAYVTDRNTGTPFVIYAENGDGQLNVWQWTTSNTVYSDLSKIRAKLTRVLSAPAWADGNDQPVPSPQASVGRPNLLSLRGIWYQWYGPCKPSFDTFSQLLVFPASCSANSQYRLGSTYNSKSLNQVSWGSPVAGQNYTFSVRATQGATLKLQLYIGAYGSANYFDSGDLGDGKSTTFTWQANAQYLLWATRAAGAQQATLAGSIVPITPLQP